MSHKYPQPWYRKNRGWFLTLNGKQIPLGPDKVRHSVATTRSWLGKGCRRARQNDPSFDLVEDGSVDEFDRNFWIHSLNNTYFGDANLDGEFDSTDLVAIFQVGHYEDGIALNSGWAEGDWNGNGDFESGDLIVAFQDGGYEQGPREQIAAIPEPSGIPLAVLAALLTVPRTRRKRF